ncbi:MAG: extracellular solute-binding protein [Chloroflexi bacterium]|nr:extracellular solute-binding protein [Chloroflexota bacterium]
MSLIVKSALCIVFSLFVGLAACAPKPAPAPSVPARPATAPPAPVATSNLPPPTSQDAAWDKVIAEAKKEGRVTPYTFFMVGDAGKAVAEAFEKKYGIKVEFVTGVGAVLMERIRAEAAAGKNIADTMDSAISIVATVKSLGLTQSWGQLPVTAEANVWRNSPIADPERHLLSGGIGVMTTYVNTQLVKAGEEPKSYNDLLSPQWKGKITVASPVTAPNIMFLLVTGVYDEAYLKKLAQQDLKIGPTIRDAENMLVRGEAAVMVPEADATIAAFLTQGAPVKPVDMAEGATSYSSLTVAMTKQAPHPNAARLFGNWLLSAEGQEVYFKAKGSLAIRKDVPDFRPPAARITYKKLVSLDFPGALEMARLQNERVVAKWLGLQ